jgi:hypothetical protein
MRDAGIDIWYGQSINDFDRVIQEYGDSFIVGVCPEALPEDVSREEAEASGRRFADKYCKFYKEGKPIAVFSRRANPIQVEAIRNRSREIFEGSV